MKCPSTVYLGVRCVQSWERSPAGGVLLEPAAGPLLGLLGALQGSCPSFRCQSIVEFVRMVTAPEFEVAGLAVCLAVRRPFGHAIAFV